MSVNEKNEVSIKEIARTIAREFNYEDNLVFDTTKSDGQYKKQLITQNLCLYWVNIILLR